MTAPLFQHPDGMGCIAWDSQACTLTLSNEAHGVEASASIGPDGLRELAAALLRAADERPAMTPDDFLKAAGVSMDDLLTPGVKFMLVSHDNDCPGALGDPWHCCCDPEIRMVNEADYVAAVNKTQAQDRQTRHAAERALKKAQSKGGSQ